jgi:PAT family beta-lactamase induction signal transducer AmpG
LRPDRESPKDEPIFFKGTPLLSTRLKYTIVALLYFSEGFPFGFIYGALPIYLRLRSISLEEIGVLSILGLAWSLKILWAPLIDRFGRRFYWIVPCQALLALLLSLLVLLDPISQRAFLWLALAAIGLTSATQDIAVDAYTIDILEEKELGLANGIRSAFYRVAMITAGGVLVMFSEALGWENIFLLAGALMAILSGLVMVFPVFHLPRPEIPHSPPIWESWIGPIQILFRRPQMGITMLFIFSFKIGEAMLVAMANPFWIDRGFSPKEIGWAVGTLGALASIVGAMAGGYLTSRWGILSSLWILGGFQATASLGYMIAAFPFAPSGIIYFSSLLESLAIGMATAAFLSFLMGLCEKRYSATHFAFLSMLFGLGRSLAGLGGGYSASWMGYPAFFAFSFFMGAAPLLLIPFLRPALAWVSREGGDVRENP